MFLILLCYTFHQNVATAFNNIVCFTKLYKRSQNNMSHGAKIKHQFLSLLGEIKALIKRSKFQISFAITGHRRSCASLKSLLS